MTNNENEAYALASEGDWQWDSCAGEWVVSAVTV